MVQLSPGTLVDFLKHSTIASDAILIDMRVEGGGSGFSPNDFFAGFGVAAEIRQLPDYCAMDDGRKWSRMPIIIKRVGPFSYPADPLFESPDKHLVEISFGSDITQAYRVMRSVVWDYYKCVANDFDNVGNFVFENRGRLRIEAAYRPRRDANTTYYYGFADRRRASFFTLARDMEGDENDLIDFSDLIDPRMHATEHKLHHFLADTTNYLTVVEQVISHPRIGRGRGSSELDFVLRPYLNQDGAAAWSLLEIKRADQPIMVDLHTQDPRLAAALFRFGKQIQRYKQLIDDPRSREKVLAALGGLPKDAKLAILVGRRPGKDRDGLREKFGELYPDVKLVTYDDLYEARVQALSLY